MDELDARDAFECLGSCLIGVDLVRRRAARTVEWGREIVFRLGGLERINEASNGTVRN